ncbi:MAG TPA: redoxin domain-containing protein [Planctomycetota bacterium]|nr:redoxin domain-containing protein [Planctomycetota bacterium]
MHWKLLLLAPLLVVVAGCGDSTQSPPLVPPPPAKPGVSPGTPDNPALSPAPAVQFAKGETLTEASFAKLLKTPRMKYTVVTVFAADCAPCITESKHLAELVDTWKKRRVNLVGISADVTVERIDKFITQVGGAQNYAMYLAPWFIENNKIDGTPVLFVFKPDGTQLMKVSVDDTPEPLKALQTKLDELQQGTPETTPGADRDPGVLLHDWCEDQLDATEERLPDLVKGIQAILQDQPPPDTTPEQLAAMTERYRPCLKSPRGWLGRVDKQWLGKTAIQHLTVTAEEGAELHETPVNAQPIPGAQRVIKAVTEVPNGEAVLSVLYDPTLKLSQIVVQITITSDANQSAKIAAANLNPADCTSRVVFRLRGESPPDKAMPILDALPH